MTPRETFLASASFTLLVACGGANATPPESAERGATSPSGAGRRSLFDEGDEAAPFRFSWALPCRVPVTTVTKKGSTVRFSFFLDVQRGGDKVHARFDDMRALELNGRDIRGPALQRELAPALALANAIPTLEVSRSGKFERAIGVDEMLDRVIAEARKNPDPEQQAAIIKLAKSPEMRAELENYDGDYWTQWVGAWVDFEARPGMPRHADTETRITGATLPFSVHLHGEHLGDSRQYPGTVHLRLTSTMDGKKSPKALEQFTDSVMAEAAPTATRMAPIFVKQFDTVTVFEAHTDPATLRPTHVLVHSTVNMDMGKGVKTTYESREDTFDWTNATGCSRGH